MKNISLTYDDGPNTPYTLDLLSVLSKHDVGATFFMVGNRIQERPDIVKVVAAAGHWIGNHTVTHPKLPEMSLAEVEQEIDGCANILNTVLGYKCYSHMFRPPYLLCSALRELIRYSKRVGSRR